MPVHTLLLSIAFSQSFWFFEASFAVPDKNATKFYGTDRHTEKQADVNKLPSSSEYMGVYLHNLTFCYDKIISSTKEDF